MMLAMLHSNFTNPKASTLAERLRNEHPDDPTAQVTRTFELLLSRPPTATELTRSLTFLESLQTTHQLDPATALTRFTLAALNFNEFLFLD